MPIVISRETGAIISAPVCTPEQTDRAWEAVTKAWAEANKAQLQALAKEYASEPCGK